MKWLSVTSIPTASTLWYSVLPAVRRPEGLSDRVLLKAWKHAYTAQYMMQRSIRPRSLRRNQRHILYQCANAEFFNKIEAEVQRRGLLDRYEIDITLCKGRPCKH